MVLKQTYRQIDHYMYQNGSLASGRQIDHNMYHNGSLAPDRQIDHYMNHYGSLADIQADRPLHLPQWFSSRHTDR